MVSGSPGSNFPGDMRLFPACGANVVFVAQVPPPGGPQPRVQHCRDGRVLQVLRLHQELQPPAQRQ